MGGGCVDTAVDWIASDSDCHGGRCDAKYITEFSINTHLCDKKFTACGIEYQLKYTGKQGSCMRLKWFEDRRENYGKKYAHLTRGGKNVGECLVWNKLHDAKYCSGNLIAMDALLRCWIHR